MKTLDQIICYISHCRFPEEDWEQVLTYCRNHYTGGCAHKSQNPLSDSSYEQFVRWIDSGYGTGDFVRYGNTYGVIGVCTPFKIFLAAYCDFDGNIIVKNMEVRDPERLQLLDDHQCAEFKARLYDCKYECCVRLGKVTELYIPKKYFYASLYNGGFKCNTVGMYLESDGRKHHFAAYLDGNALQMDCWIDSQYTPLQPASERDINRLHKATAKAGWAFNARTNTFIKQPKRGENNLYWYMNECFEIVSDKDCNRKRDNLRYKAGNYFLDQMEALTFCSEVNKLLGEAH